MGPYDFIYEYNDDIFENYIHVDNMVEYIEDAFCVSFGMGWTQILQHS